MIVLIPLILINLKALIQFEDVAISEGGCMVIAGIEQRVKISRG